MTTNYPVQFVKSTLKLYLSCLTKAAVALKQNLIILIGSVLLYGAFLLVAKLVAPLGFAGGFVLGLLGIGLLSLYYNWLNEISQGRKVKLNSLIEFDYGLFSALLSVAFIFFIAKYILSSLLQGTNISWIASFFQLGLVIVLNAIPEVIYIHRYESIPAISYAAKFTRENWIEWFLPFVLFLAPVILINANLAVVLMAQSSELLPTLLIVKTWQLWGSLFGDMSSIIISLLALIISSCFMIFRAFLFTELESGSRRKRMYNA